MLDRERPRATSTSAPAPTASAWSTCRATRSTTAASLLKEYKREVGPLFTPARLDELPPLPAALLSSGAARAAPTTTSRTVVAARAAGRPAPTFPEDELAAGPRQHLGRHGQGGVRQLAGAGLPADRRRAGRAVHARRRPRRPARACATPAQRTHHRSFRARPRSTKEHRHGTRRDPGHPRRLRARPDHQGGRGADLPDRRLRVRRRPARRRPVQPRGARQHLHPHHEPDPGRARAARRRARGRRRGAGDQLRAGRDHLRDPDHHAASATTSSPCRCCTAAPTPCSSTCSRAQGIEVRFADDDSPEAFAQADRRQDQGGLPRVDRQPGRQHPRHRGHRQGRPRRRRAAHRRQHRARRRSCSSRSSGAPTSSSTR